ncbi:MAG TPA: cupredoxin domain-containing protein [Candidatus Nanoarchaeia archaeon]|nr:cupredoxin domain-containing protein [Candidatus Nanoarchaeia archaeon]
MKIQLAIVAMLALFMAGCATQPASQPAAAPIDDVADAPAEAPAVEDSAVADAPAGGDVTFNGRGGFDPETITVAAGSSISIVVRDAGSSSYSFVVRETGDKTTQVADGEISELTFDTKGAYTVLSVPFSKKLSVEVE